MVGRDPHAFLDRYEQLTAAVRTRHLRRTPRLLAGVAAFFAWCDRRGVDPILWAHARHEAAWSSNPAAMIPIERLPAEGFLVAYRGWAERRSAVTVEQERLAASAVEDDPCGRDGSLVPLAEAVKASLGHAREVCMIDDLTLGWHPASTWCVACPLAVPCRERLGRRRPAVLARRIAGAS